ncbi:hypothetical protein MKZ38_009181 [Zalerion maritima]|uniref:Uncharacterized protein n=1 Tax=Zalerion maritima TaxID=339359 RepID=A0AAD5RUT1_9PEZI|nr:hypothetical protein MKZ38_009181 [Zalerion maritima]
MTSQNQPADPAVPRPSLAVPDETGTAHAFRRFQEDQPKPWSLPPAQRSIAQAERESKQRNASLIDEIMARFTSPPHQNRIHR